jgi:hypothetical protein
MDNERGSLYRRSRSSRCTARAAVILLGNQLPMPSHQRCRRDDCPDMFQNCPAELLRLGCEAAALAIRESHPPIPDLFSKDTIFLDEIFDDLLLMLVHPASDGDDQEREWVQARAHFRSLARSS